MILFSLENYRFYIENVLLYHFSRLKIHNQTYFSSNFEKRFSDQG